MAFTHVQAIEVQLFEQPVGVIALNPQLGYYGFEYYPAWLAQGQSISPLHLPLQPGTFTFPELSENTWKRLPAAISDALPDRFGNSLINARLAQQGVTSEQITPLDRLAYVADRSMGALSFKPTRSLGKEPDVVEISQMVLAARAALRGSIDNSRGAQKMLKSLLSIGVSAGGARAKAVLNVDPLTQTLRSGQRPEVGYESWLLKFDGVGADSGLGESRVYGRIEYAYSLMARDAGINMPQTKLLEEDGRAHFMVRRFDRIDAPLDGTPQKLHMQSLCAMDHVDFNLLHTNDYGSLFAVIRRLELTEDALVETFKRMALNHLAANCDDHAKNFSFLMDAQGQWRLAPAYDITFAYNSHNVWLREHLMSVDGKFFEVDDKDLLAFAERHKIPFAKRSLKQVREALANWPDYARHAGLTESAAAEISAHFS